MPTVFISVGSNIEREKYIRAGINALNKHFGKLTLSSVYESDAVGFDGSSFLNLIVAFDTEQSPEHVDATLDQIEKQNGRTSGQKKFNPRTLDLDLVLYGDHISTNPSLEIPRDEITQYAFVLEPLAEVAGSLKHPITNKSYHALWEDFNKQGIVQKRIPFNWD